METLNLLTKNPFKLATARLALAPLGIEVEPVELDLPEIQADTNLEIARAMAVEAARFLNRPVAREDHGFFLNALPGFPGPYMNYIEKRIQPSTVIDWLRDQEDRAGYFELGLVYAQPSGEVQEFVAQVPARIVDSLQEGARDFGWDNIIALGEKDLAISQYPPEERYRFFTGNFERLGQWLSRDAHGN